MACLITGLIFVVVRIIAFLCARICCNRDPSTNLYASSFLLTCYAQYFLTGLGLWILRCSSLH
ncbi:unnamed protein product [Linum tenue]|uniref:Uncharacterized protein n=1 Tax=Linum tenue TaxID=586396 RepID=A0AAV0H7Z1_9ROSI|nr:unnamed protein product [Linum tenue]